MTLRQVKVIYWVAVVTIAILLGLAGGLLHWIAAVALVAGALPMFRAVHRATKAATLHDVEQQALLMADSTMHAPQPQRHQGQLSQSNQ